MIFKINKSKVVGNKSLLIDVDNHGKFISYCFKFDKTKDIQFKKHNSIISAIRTCIKYLKK